MDFTPRLENISEDSGCITATFENSSSVKGSTSNAISYIETPVGGGNSSRKRKLLPHDHAIKNLSALDSSYFSPALFEHDVKHVKNFLSSTLNDSLTVSLERCNLDNCTPDVYMEHSFIDCETEHERYFKKIKIDECYLDKPKIRSAPSTPTKELQRAEVSVSKAQSEVLGKVSNKNYGYQNPRLGSPEVMELLYPNIQSNSPASKRTPQKVLDSLKKFNSPAKKRLFDSSNAKKYCKKIDRDPVSVFFVKKSCCSIIQKIFSYLTDSDLYNVSNVSKSWREALNVDKQAMSRYTKYIEQHKNNKENFVKLVRQSTEPDSPPVSPKRRGFHKCTKLASMLEPNQSLRMCPQCNEPAVVQNSVGQCQNLYCQYIYCLKCSSFSVSGPEDFVDKCQMSKLVLDNKKKPTNRFGLIDISNATNSDLPQMFLENSSYVSQSKYDSSGYLSEGDIFSPVTKNSPVTCKSLDRCNILKDSNRSYTASQKSNRRPSLVSVVSNDTPKSMEIMEPSSPPKVKNIACSRQSKKNLKRLKF